MSRGLLEQPFVSWIAAHHAIERDQISDGQPLRQVEQVAVDDGR
jgi:hypothetical protein